MCEQIKQISYVLVLDIFRSGQFHTLVHFLISYISSLLAQKEADKFS